MGEFGKCNLDSFENLVEAIWLSIENKNSMDKKRLRLNLLLARGFDYLIAQLKPVFGEKQLQIAIEHIKTNVANNKRDIPFLWDKRGIYLLYPEIGYPLDEVDRLTKVRTAKKLQDEDKVLRGLQFLEQQQPFAKIYKAILLWYTGRYWLLLGMPEKAIDFYKKAFNEMEFVWGRDIAEKFIEESLAVTAFLGKDRRFFEDVYHYGVLIGLFKPLEEREVDYQYHQWGLAFNKYFSPDAYYHSVSTAQKQKIIEQGSWIKAATFDEINQAADKKTNTNVFNTRPKSQLQLAIHARDKTAEDVIKFINNGVDVNFMDNSGSTALIEALQKYYGLLGTEKNEKASKIINRLLVEDLSKNINSVTKGKGISALSLAIEVFDLEMISRLIKKGADAKGSCHKPEMSYVYYTLYSYACNQQMLSMQSPEQIIAMMASNNSGANPQFGATAQEQAAHAMQLMKNPRDKQILDEVRKCYSAAYQEINANEDKTVAIIKLLLKNGASPDGHFINDLTPLMLAIELGLTKVVELLLEYEADINALNNCGKNAVDYAIGFDRPEIKNLLVNNFHNTAN